MVDRERLERVATAIYAGWTEDEKAHIACTQTPECAARDRALELIRVLDECTESRERGPDGVILRVPPGTARPNIDFNANTVVLIRHNLHVLVKLIPEVAALVGAAERTVEAADFFSDLEEAVKPFVKEVA